MTISSITKKGLFSLLDAREGPARGVICILVTLGILMAGLWPFNFTPANKVERLHHEHGIRFYGRGMVFSAEPLTVPKTDSRSAQVTIEIFLRPDKEPNNGVPFILSLYGNDRVDQFRIGQWQSTLIIRIPAIKTDRQKNYREIGVGGALKKETMSLITITSGEDSTDVFIDGKREKQFPHYALIRNPEGLSGHLILGNSSAGTAPWSGSVFGLAIYDRTLSVQEALEHDRDWRQGGERLLSKGQRPIALYLFDEGGGQLILNQAGSRSDLQMPLTFYPLRRIILGLPDEGLWFSRSNLLDVAINILGFLPFGLFLTAWLIYVKKIPYLRACGISILLGFSISLMIELTQAYLPMRDSSLLDLINNVLGTAIGALLLGYRHLTNAFACK